MSGWLLSQVAIEGFRGINNHGDPLKLKFKTDRINSVFATNGIGKSSVFDAISYALTGAIPKLQNLPAAESGHNYYLNRFHPGTQGSVALTLTPAGGGADVIVTVVRDANGDRTVTTSDGSNGEATLKELNREFVLLDAHTFQSFIDVKPLERGRAFAGLLGLGSYSTLLQGLQAASNTRAFNNHFDVRAIDARRTAASRALATTSLSAAEAYKALVGEDLDPVLSFDVLLATAYAGLANIPLIKPTCDGKTFDEIVIDDCLAVIKEAEGGKDRDRLAVVIRSQTSLDEASKLVPDLAKIDRLVTLAGEYDAALAKTQGDDFLKLYGLARKIVASDDWSEKALCPACDNTGEFLLPDYFNEKVSEYEAVEQAATAIRTEWVASSWVELTKLETLASTEGEISAVGVASSSVADGKFTSDAAEVLKKRIVELVARAQATQQSLADERLQIEQRLPPSLVAVTQKVEAARQLQKAFVDQAAATEEKSELEDQIARITRVKSFLDTVSKTFSSAESTASTRRLAAVEPVFQSMFQNIMFEQVVPGIGKRAGSEELTISLPSFYNLENVSAQSLLSESFRNAFAISIYLAAASLYGGAAKFLLLDDVTSSFDGGHQFHLMEVIRASFARPMQADGPQVILLSHDTLLEKYFNTQSHKGGWWHQRIQGTPRTAVLPQSNAVSRIRTRIDELLDVGDTASAAPRIREFLEFSLEQVVARCRVPVPIDLAISDDKRMCNNYLTAIDEAVKLHDAAGSLVLDEGQKTGLNTAMATIIANFLSHWSTNQTGTFTSGSLRGVVVAIDTYCDCFKFDPADGGARKFYKNLATVT